MCYKTGTFFFFTIIFPLYFLSVITTIYELKYWKISNFLTMLPFLTILPNYSILFFLLFGQIQLNLWYFLHAAGKPLQNSNLINYSASLLRLITQHFKTLCFHPASNKPHRGWPSINGLRFPVLLSLYFLHKTSLLKVFPMWFSYFNLIYFISYEW